MVGKELKLQHQNQLFMEITLQMSCSMENGGVEAHTKRRREDVRTPLDEEDKVTIKHSM